MTSDISTIAGNYRGSGAIIKCIIDEGAPTNVTTSMMADGQTLTTTSWASPLEEGQVVALANDATCTYTLTEGMPVVQRAVNAETLVIGQIVSTPQLVTMPPSTFASTAETLAKRLATKVYRTALVEFHVPGKIYHASVMCDGTRTVVPGVATTVTFNMASAYTAGNRGLHVDMNASNGVGCIPLTYVASSTDGELFSCLILVTGLLYSTTGA
jgi:hypothetical protein